MPNPARIIAVVIGVTLLIAIAMLGLFSYLILAPAGPEKDELFMIEKGESMASIVERLENARYIPSALSLRIYARVRGDDAKIKAGTYQLSPGMNAVAQLSAFVAGRQAQVRVTVPEGYTLRQTAELLAKKGIVTEQDFLAAAGSASLLRELGIPAASLEGYLFPDTYLFPLGYSGEDLVRIMVGAFRDRIAAIPGAERLSPAALHEKLILASIVEREYRIPDEAPIMAGVFYNRLRSRIALQSCATVVYVITEKLGKSHPEVIYDRDLKLDDPYNTYLFPGLPPGPISNPGLTAIDASINPAKTDYYYFRLIDADQGKHRFSRTLEEHVSAKTFSVKRIGG